MCGVVSQLENKLFWKIFSYTEFLLDLTYQCCGHQHSSECHQNNSHRGTPENTSVPVTNYKD